MSVLIILSTMQKTVRASLFALALLAAPFMASAQIEDICDVLTLVELVLTWFGILVFIVAVIFILYAGFLFITSGGNEETRKKASSTLLWGLIGIAVALLATNAIPFVQATVGGQTFDNCVPSV
ncbi:hypothetical protein C4552_01625 [Candidatus Parcubacteria bacterium]|nr:MAG: hypothetical protein C4552_01625 [Candidatus Parcubacteria bacterium]